MSRFLEKRITPKTLIIILVIIIGVGGVIYNSNRKINVQTEQTAKVVESDQSGRLADTPFEQVTAPKFIFYPPAGWNKLPATGNMVVEYTSPSEDKIEEGVAWLTVRPNITVFVSQEKSKNLDEANDLIIQKQKIKINGEDAVAIESVRDISDSARSSLEAQAGQSISTAQKDIDEVLKKAKARLLSFSFYRDGYYINVTGKALESFWEKRGPELKRSLDTFKFF